MRQKRRDFLKVCGASALGLWIETLLPYYPTWAGDWKKQPVSPMIYRPYGKTGKQVSLLGFGGMRFEYEPVSKGNYDQGAEVVTYAYDLGVNYFDSAPRYVRGESEKIIGVAIKEIKRKNQGKKSPLPFYLTTKSSSNSEKTAGEVRRRIDDALKNYGHDKIHFFHMWSIIGLEQYKAVMAKGGPYEGAMEAKKEGLIDHIVFSTHSKPKDTMVMLNDDVFEGMLISYNIINSTREAEPLELAFKKGIGVVTMNPLAGGLIPQNEDYFSRLMDPANQSITIAQTALAFNMGHPGISVVLSGMKAKDQVMENVKTLNFLKLFKEEELAVIRRQFLQKVDQICTTCEYCDLCPVKIPVYDIMDLYNSVILNGKEQLPDLATRFDKHHKKPLAQYIDDCIACGACEKICTQQLPILERFAAIRKEIK